MMYSSLGWHSGLVVLTGIHMVAMTLVLFGLFFLALLAYRTLSNEQLKRWGIGFLLSGIIFCLLTAVGVLLSVRHASFSKTPLREREMYMMRSVPQDDVMMQGQKGRNVSGGMHMEMMDDDARSMGMDAMGAALKGLSGDEFDRSFLELMIVHHQGALDMAKEVMTSGKHEELKQLAQNILTTQQQEIDQMKAWQEAWGYLSR